MKKVTNEFKRINAYKMELSVYKGTIKQYASLQFVVKRKFTEACFW